MYVELWWFSLSDSYQCEVIAIFVPRLSVKLIAERYIPTLKLGSNIENDITVENVFEVVNKF